MRHRPFLEAQQIVAVGVELAERGGAGPSISLRVIRRVAVAVEPVEAALLAGDLVGFGRRGAAQAAAVGRRQRIVGTRAAGAAAGSGGAPRSVAARPCHQNMPAATSSSAPSAPSTIRFMARPLARRLAAD